MPGVPSSTSRSPVDAVRSAIDNLRRGDPRELTAWLRQHLFAHVLPFWERHAFDPAGGLLTCITGDGRVVSTDKWLWSQWRAVWVFSRIYNTLDRNPHWLRRAQHIADFCLRTGWDAQHGGWALVLDRNGQITRGHESTYVDAFALYGLQELYRASGDEQYARAARQTADRALEHLSGAYDRIPQFPYPVPEGVKPRAIPMIWSLKLAEAGATLGEPRCSDAARKLADEIFRDFYDPARDVILELIHADGSQLAGPPGRAVIPGHTLEDMWFQFHVSELTGHGHERAPELFRLMLRHLQLGWDETRGGGLLLAIDAEGREPVGWNFADTKLWWPHTEALYATLLGWRHTRQPAFLEWYERVWDVCLEHFVDWKHGEWRQKLDRDFNPIDTVVALPVKDPFHLPRSLILQIELLERSG